MSRILFLLLVCILLAGCSSKAVYDNMQRNNRQQCANEPPAHYEECIERSSKSYEEYKRDRAEVLKPE